MDKRYTDLSEVLTGFSINLQENEKVLIAGFDVPDEIVIALIRAVRARGGIPFVQQVHTRVQRELMRNGVEFQYEHQCGVELGNMKAMDAYIAVRGADNIFEMSDVPPEKMKMAMGLMRPVQDWRVNKTKWVVLRWPTSAMAQQALMSTEAFEDFYFRVCTLDYSRMVPGMAALNKRMTEAKEVQLTGPGTDLRFSLEGMGAVSCGGTHNIPDGEVFSCPVKDSVEGQVTYNAPSVYQGTSFDQICLRFKAGKIVEATSSNTEKLNEILDSDVGARYVGEFAIGFNPHIMEPMRDILFDEKIAGSFHFTPGQAYELVDNGNRSQVHWDLVNIQRPEYGGGEIIFDGEVIRRDGVFVPEDLQKLNPDYLLDESTGS